MFKLCKNCDSRIGLIERFSLWRNNTHRGYVCEECDSQYKPTILSMAALFIILWSSYVHTFKYELYLEIGYFQCLILLVIVTRFIPTLVIRYKKVR